MLNYTNDTIIYCAIDTELSGFDPDEAEILELGLVFFVFENGNYKELERYEKIFRPKGEVSTTILALTGLKMEELQRAEPFFESVFEVQKKLNSVVLVGHNLTLDIKFLEKYGIKLSGRTIDTLDLAQIILPTCPSYNLESLMHFLSIEHQNAHRALADSLACVKLLYSLHGVFQSLNESLRKQFIEKSQRFFPDWGELLKNKLEKNYQKPVSKTNTVLKEQVLKLNRGKEDEVINCPVKMDALDLVCSFLKHDSRENLLVVLPSNDDIRVFQESFGISVVVREHESLNIEKYNRFFSRDNLSMEEIRFILKVMLWLGEDRTKTNTTELNCNFSGGQFLREITGNSAVSVSSGLVFCSMETLFDLPKSFVSKDYELVFTDIEVFEKQLALASGARISWGYVSSVLKSIYNPESGVGEEGLASRVVDLLASTDLFFALINLYFRPIEGKKTIASLDELNPFFLSRMKNAYEKYREKLNELLKLSRVKPIKQIVSDMDNFFSESPEMIKWIEFGDRYVSLQMRKLDLRKDASAVYAGFRKVVFVDFALDSLLLGYYKKRLGLESFVEQGVWPEVLEMRSVDLVSEGLSYFDQSNKLPLVVLFNSQATLKRFYEDNYENLKARANLLALHLTGGVKKVVSNFSIRKDSVLLLTYDALSANSHFRVEAESLWFYENFEIKLNHPYALRLNSEVELWGIEYKQVLARKASRLFARVFVNSDMKVLVNP